MRFRSGTVERGTEVPESRPTCYSCDRPQSHCVCSLIPPFTAHCGVVVLQHPHERRKYYSTLKLLRPALQNLTFLRGIEFEPQILEKLFAEKRTWLLYPGVDAADCSATPLGADDQVVVLDGTWSEAGKILRRNPILATLPKISFAHEVVSEYTIRKQPRRGYLSTLESIAIFLTQNAVAQSLPVATSTYPAMLEGFREMVRRQVQHFPRYNPDAKPRLRSRREQAPRAV